MATEAATAVAHTGAMAWLLGKFHVPIIFSGGDLDVGQTRPSVTKNKTSADAYTATNEPRIPLFANRPSISRMRTLRGADTQQAAAGLSANRIPSIAQARHVLSTEGVIATGWFMGPRRVHAARPQSRK